MSVSGVPPSPPGLSDELGGFPIEEKDVDRIWLSLSEDLKGKPVDFAAGLCLCETTDSGLSYKIIGSNGPAYLDPTAEGLVRDCLSVCGERIQVTFLLAPGSFGSRYHFLAVPRGIEALVPADWRPGAQVGGCGGSDGLDSVGFDRGSRLRFIGDFALRGCPNLTSFFIPAAVERIGDYSFWNCVNLSAVTMEGGSRLRSLGRWAFAGCVRLQFADLPSKLESLAEMAFWKCNFSALPLGSLRRLSRIRESACDENYSLASVLIPGNVVEIGFWAFYECVSLLSVDFVLPSKLRSIHFGAFAGCQSLTQFRIVESVTRIHGSFLQGSGVREITVDRDNAKFETMDAFLVSRDRKKIVCYFGNDSDVRIGANVETIGPSSFEKCQFLRSVTFEPASKLKRIGGHAFEGCRSLELVRFGGRCPSLGDFCFCCCDGLREIVFHAPSDYVPPSRFSGIYVIESELLSESAIFPGSS
jgi:hypothetical protein